MRCTKWKIKIQLKFKLHLLKRDKKFKNRKKSSILKDKLLKNC